MKVIAEKIPERRVVLNIEVDGSEVEKSLQETYKRLVQRVKIPGFRQGKAPRAVLQNYLGKEALLDEALDQMIPDVVKRAMKEQELEASDSPKVEVLGKNPVKLKAIVPLQPSVELGDYRSIQVEPEEIEVKQEEVENTIEELRRRQAPWIPVDRPAAFGDLLTVDVEGTIDGKNVVKEKNGPYIPTEEGNRPVPGFAQQLIGMEKGSTREFPLAVPEDFRDEGLRNKQCRFNVTVHEIKEKQLPPLDDDFARSLGEEYDSLEELREKVRFDLKAHVEEIAQRQLEEKLMEALKEKATVEAPPDLREREIDHLIMDEARSLAARGVKFENYLKTIGKTIQEVREDFKEMADERVTNSLLLSKLAEAEAIKVEDSEVDQEIERLVQSAGSNGDQLRQAFNKEENRSSLKQTIQNRKALERLKEIGLKTQATKAATPGTTSPEEKKSEVQNES